MYIQWKLCAHYDEPLVTTVSKRKRVLAADCLLLTFVHSETAAFVYNFSSIMITVLPHTSLPSLSSWTMFLLLLLLLILLLLWKLFILLLLLHQFYYYFWCAFTKTTSHPSWSPSFPHLPSIPLSKSVLLANWTICVQSLPLHIGWLLDGLDFTFIVSLSTPYLHTTHCTMHTGCCN